ncbi:MAG TPA: M28 family peptidase [Thermoanaerobaculia bacterium]|nr:M28 family peptidase [Thermoanaerobaculia bacterium]
MKRRPDILVTVALAATCALTLWRLQGPRPLPAEAPDAEFSAVRARTVLAGLIREGVPHPVGSAANRVVRDRILAAFRERRYQTEVQGRFVCNARPTCAEVENIIATPPGATGDLVFLAAHYDSVAAGPGASDDGAGVAALLEIARILNGSPGIAFLITDGEEAGLLGAEAFVADPYRLQRMRAVVNVEYRGTSGPSFLFETSRNNAALIAAAASSLRRPASTSLFPAIYDLLPNDTDLTVFKRAAKPAVNFAAIGGVDHYHTATDDLAHVDLETLQHHGENALSIARELAARPSLAAEQNAVFFDVLSFGIIRWPQRWTLFLVLGSLVLLVIGGPVRKPALHSLRFFLAAPAIAALLGFAAAAIWPRPTPWPSMAIAAMWAIGFLAAVLAAFLVRRFEARDVFIATGIGWHAAAIVLALALPGASYLFVFPAIIISLCVVTRLYELAPLAAAVVIFPLALMLHTALGRTGFVPAAVLIALVGTTFAFHFRSRHAALVTGSVALVATLLVFAGERRGTAPSTAHELDAPKVQATATRSGNRLTLRLRSPRQADTITASFDPAVRVVSVNGAAPAPLNPRRRPRPPVVTVYGHEAVIELETGGAVDVTIRDRTFGAGGAFTEHRIRF